MTNWNSLARVPQRIGRFETIRLLGQGGFAKVFLCRDDNLNRLVAIKVPKPHALLSAEARRRFEREARAAAMLSHPAIVPVFQNDLTGPVTYLVCAYCEGPTLAEWIPDHREQINPQVAARIVRRLAEAVEHAHQRGVIHRDLKPSNILVESDYSSASIVPQNDVEDSEDSSDISQRLRITDFGLAKYTHDLQSASLTVDGSVLGTPAYMSPEQARGETAVGVSTDVYSLGTILYELLTGTTPFRRTSHLATLRAIEDEAPKPLRQVKPGIPKDLEAICLKCLEKQPRRRYSTAHELSGDLSSWLEGRPVIARCPTRLDRFYSWLRRNPALAVTLAIVLFPAC